MQYSPGYSMLMHAWGGASDALARLRARATHEGTRVHPADLDDALCTSAVVDSRSASGEPRLPFAVDDALLQGAPGELWAVRYAISALAHPPLARFAAWLHVVVCAIAGRGAAGRGGGVGAAGCSGCTGAA